MTAKAASKARSARQASLEAQLPPHDPLNETCALGSMLLDAAAIDECREAGLVAAHFFSEQHQHIARALFSMRDTDAKVDAVTVAEYLQRIGKLDAAGGAAKLIELLEAVPYATHAQSYARVVIDRSRRRAADAAARIILQNVNDLGADTADILTAAEKQIHEALEFGSVQQDTTIGARLQEALAQLGQPRAEVIATGFPSIDKVSGGFEIGSLVVVAARPSVGGPSGFSVGQAFCKRAAGRVVRCGTWSCTSRFWG